MIEEEILGENILTQEHITDSYNLYVIACRDDKLKMIPSEFISFFNSVLTKKNMLIDQQSWDYIFYGIDSNKDGSICFQDFMKFLYKNLKIILNEIGEKISINRLSLATTYKERCEFQTILQTIFYKNVTSINPFSVVEAARGHQPPYVEITLNFKKNGEFLAIDSETKNNSLLECILQLNSNEWTDSVQSGLNHQNYETVYQTVIYLSGLLKPFQYVSSPFEIYNLIPQIISVFNTFALKGIFERLLWIFDIQYNYANSIIIVKLLKIFRLLIHINSQLFNLHIFSFQNNLNYTKAHEEVIIKLNEYIEVNMISKLILKSSFLFASDLPDISNNTLKLCLEIMNKNSYFMNLIYTQTEFFSFLMKRIEILTDTNIMFQISKNSNINTSFELKKCLICCVNLMVIITSMKNEYYEMNGMINNKILWVAEIFREYFIISDRSFQYYYLILVGLLTKKTAFDDRFFLPRGQEILGKNLYNLFRPFSFYLKNFLLSKIKKDYLTLLTDFKTLQLFDSILEKAHELYCSEFIEILDILISEHKSELITSPLLREIVVILDKLLKNSQSVVQTRKLICLLKTISSYKEPFIESLILDSEIITSTLRSVLNFRTKDEFFDHLYFTNKILYDTILLGDILVFLISLLQSEIVRSPVKFLKNFNINSLSNLVELFDFVYNLKNPQDSEAKEIKELQESQTYNFEKFEDCIPFNIFVKIFEIFKNCEDLALNFKRQCIDQGEVDRLLQFLEISLDQFKIKLRILKEIDLNMPEEILEIEYDEILIYAQTKNELSNNLFTIFKFPEAELQYSYVTQTIEKYYKQSLCFYYFNEDNGYYERIKDENDFVILIGNLVVLSKQLNKTSLQMKMFVEDLETINMYKYISTCLSCHSKFEVKEKSIENSENTQICDSCKSIVLEQFVSNISVNKSLNHSFPNLSPISKFPHFK